MADAAELPGEASAARPAPLAPARAPARTPAAPGAPARALACAGDTLCCSCP
ncbi:hypothetical protein [Actinomadura decatromicini]|uniref:hypothetical protein n=1 Tax=Actinomadura decatromicini TaxID=2604572 RepID=UPI0016534168|nr:hypothetical protein [Actinomadura decatromicini]